MIIELDKSIAIYAKLSEKNLQIASSAINIIALSRKDGNHFIFSEIDVALELIKLLDMQDVSKSILKRVINKYPEKAAMAENIKIRILVGDFPETSITENKDTKLKIIKVPISRVNISFVQKTYLLVENYTDAKFYEILTKNTPIGRIPIDFEAFPGGGDTTADALFNISKSNRFCLCIVDSDIRFEGGAEGGTAKKVISKSIEIFPSLTDYYVLPVSSAENLIPIETMKLASANDPGQVERIEALRKIYNDNAWPYLGIKKGVRCIDVVSEKTATEIFWRKIVGENKNIDNCKEKIDLGNCDKKKCDNFLYPSLGTKTLQNVVNFLEKNEKMQADTDVKSVKLAWDNISNLVVGWCCSGGEIFAI